jgi:antitoxin VapB
MPALASSPISGIFLCSNGRQTHQGYLTKHIQIEYADVMTKTNISKTHKAKAAQSPEAVALPDDVTRVSITQRNKKKSTVSASRTWADFFAGPRIDDDFLNDRNQPAFSKLAFARKRLKELTS